MKSISNNANLQVVQSLHDAATTDRANYMNYVSASSAVKAQRGIELIRWVDRIEQSLGDSVKMAQIKLARREQVLTFYSLQLFAYHTYRKMLQHRETIRAIVKSGYEAFDAQSGEKVFDAQILKEVLINNILVAIAAERQQAPVESFDPRLNSAALNKEIAGALAEAFEELTAGMKRCRRDSTYTKCTMQDVVGDYPAEIVVTSGEVGEQSVYFDRRQIDFLPFDGWFHDCAEVQHSALASLPVLGAALTEVLHSWQIELRGDIDYLKRKVKEERYAETLMSRVQGVDEPEDKTGSKAKAAQNERRRDFHSAYIALWSARQLVLSKRRALAAALKEAIAEVSQLDGNTHDGVELRSVGIINCLAADELLRFSGRRIIVTEGDLQDPTFLGAALKRARLNSKNTVAVTPAAKEACTVCSITAPAVEVDRRCCLVGTD